MAEREPTPAERIITTASGVIAETSSGKIKGVAFVVIDESGRIRVDAHGFASVAEMIGCLEVGKTILERSLV